MTIYKQFTTLLCFAWYLHATAGLTASNSSQIVLPSHEITKRVVSDVDCQIEQFPFLISFRKPKSKSIFCSGTLVTLGWALAAAHCFEKTTVLSSLRAKSIAVAGSTTLSIDDETDDDDKQLFQKREVDLVYIHHLYDSIPSFRHDIAMVKFNKHFELSDWLHIVSLPRHGETDRCKVAVIAGWAKEVALQETLKCAYNTTISSDEDCKNAWRWEFIPALTICSGDLEGKAIGPCYEDAGGPLICQEINVSNLLIGIFSQTRDCHTPKQLMLYSRVDAYLEWIDDTMGNDARRTTSNVYFLIVMLLVHVISQKL